MALMDFFRPEPSIATQLMTATPASKVQFHLDRYERAIKQCDKGPERLKQLKKERRFWERVAEAQNDL